jgi:hypothetical protein
MNDENTVSEDYGKPLYPYILDKSSKKFVCPACNKKSFVCYVEAISGSYLPDCYGRCDRSDKCKYFWNPYTEGYGKEFAEKGVRVTKVTKVTLKTKVLFSQQAKAPPVFFDFDTFKHTLKATRYKQNVFIQNLLQRVKFPFNVEDVTRVIQLYRLGTVARGYRSGAITFPFIDLNGNVRTIQVKQFDEQNHTIGTDFLHSIIEKHHTRNNKPLPEWLTDYIKQDKRVSCLFGEHLLNKHPDNPVYLFEAPKTAVYAALHFGFPDTLESPVCLAVYNKSSFSFDKIKALQGRTVYVFPDLSEDGGTFREWSNKAKTFEADLSGTRFISSDLLEQYGTPEQRAKGVDIADILIKHDWRKFRPQYKPVERSEVVTPPVGIELSQPAPVDVIDDAVNRFSYIERIARNAFGNTHTKSLIKYVHAKQQRLQELEILTNINRLTKCESPKALFIEMVVLGIIEPTPNPFVFQLANKTIC